MSASLIAVLVIKIRKLSSQKDEIKCRTSTAQMNANLWGPSQRNGRKPVLREPDRRVKAG
jgi:hypothetical protein